MGRPRSCACLCGEDRWHFGPNARRQGYRFQLEGVFAGGDHGQRHGAIGSAVEVLGFEPCAKAGIVDFGLAMPEVRLEAALDAKVAELQFDVSRAFREISTHIVRSYVEAGNAVTSALCFDHHKVPALDIGQE